jgi:hypothetical protein
MELLAAAFRLANFAEQRMKHALACRRPVEFSPQVQPMILTPSHGSLPSGHATEVFAMAVVLWNLLRAGANPVYEDASYGVQLLRQAARIAINRTVAGVHFPVDSVAGALLGLTLGQYLANRARKHGDYQALGFDGATYPEEEDFDWNELYDVETWPATVKHNGNGGKAYVLNLNAQTMNSANHSNALHWLWTKAAAEWA